MGQAKRRKESMGDNYGKVPNPYIRKSPELNKLEFENEHLDYELMVRKGMITECPTTMTDISLAALLKARYEGIRFNFAINAACNFISPYGDNAARCKWLNEMVDKLITDYQKEQL